MICFANQWTGFHVIGTSVMKELRLLRLISKFRHSYKKNSDYRPTFHSYRNQSIGFQSKSIDWFPYEALVGDRSNMRFFRILNSVCTRTDLFYHLDSFMNRLFFENGSASDVFTQNSG